MSCNQHDTAVSLSITLEHDGAYLSALLYSGCTTNRKRGVRDRERFLLVVLILFDPGVAAEA